MPSGQNEQPAANKYPIHPAIARKLEQRYADLVEQIIQEKRYTPDQAALLYYAKTFSQKLPHDEAKYPKPPNLVPLQSIDPLEIPENARAEAGEQLNQDLIERMRRFYQFLRHTELIVGPPAGIGGIRARATAHELSTKWTLNPNSHLLATRDNKIEFARRLVSLEGSPDASNINWLVPEQEKLLAEVLHIIDAPETYQSSWLFSLLSSYTMNEIIAASLPVPQQPASPHGAQSQASLAITDVYILLDRLIKECQERVTKVGNRRIQAAQAAEGFPVSEIHTRRRPNINDKTGVSNHCGGEAIDVTFSFKFNYFDPIIDAIAMHFGLYRPVKDSIGSPEHWHYERIGIDLGDRTEVESAIP